MFTPSHFISAAAAAIVLIVVLEMLRRGSLRERHALWWLFAGTIGLVVTLFPGLLEKISRLVGVENPLNLAFFGGIIVLFLTNMQQATEFTRLEARTRTLAEQVALLDDRLSVQEAQDTKPSAE